MHFLTHLIAWSWAILALILFAIILLGVASGNDRTD